jgi:hypothetical protein
MEVFGKIGVNLNEFQKDFNAEACLNCAICFEFLRKVKLRNQEGVCEIGLDFSD